MEDRLEVLIQKLKKIDSFGTMLEAFPFGVVTDKQFREWKAEYEKLYTFKVKIK
jgi:hypothetical protein